MNSPLPSGYTIFARPPARKFRVIGNGPCWRMETLKPFFWCRVSPPPTAQTESNRFMRVAGWLASCCVRSNLFWCGERGRGGIYVATILLLFNVYCLLSSDLGSPSSCRFNFIACWRLGRINALKEGYDRGIHKDVNRIVTLSGGGLTFPSIMINQSHRPTKKGGEHKLRKNGGQMTSIHPILESA
jgi:hypothetical protein